MKKLFILIVAFAAISCTKQESEIYPKHFEGNAYVRVAKTTYAVGNTFVENTCDTSFTSNGYLSHEVDTVVLPLIFNPDLPAGKQDKIFFNDEWHTECATLFNDSTIETYYFWVLIQNVDNCPTCE